MYLHIFIFLIICIYTYPRSKQTEWQAAFHERELSEPLSNTNQKSKKEANCGWKYYMFLLLQCKRHRGLWRLRVTPSAPEFCHNGTNKVTPPSHPNINRKWDFFCLQALHGRTFAWRSLDVDCFPFNVNDPEILFCSLVCDYFPFSLLKVFVRRVLFWKKTFGWLGLRHTNMGAMLISFIDETAVDVLSM